jgi:electron transfer flavoprotein beta subunit
MNIVVCLKQVLDPDIPARDFKVNAERREAERGSANLVTSIFCSNALETALQFRDAHGGKITALAFGAPSAEEILRKAIALKADEAVLVANDGPAHPDPLHVATVLAAAIQKIGPVDLVLVGRESADWGAGQTGGLLAEILGLPCLAFVDHIEPDAGQLKVRRQTETGRDHFRVKPPAVLSITNDDHNVPRVPKTKDVMLSSRKPITKWTLSDLGVAPPPAYASVVQLGIPEKNTTCEFVDGETLDDKVAALAKRIAEVVQ